MSKITVDVEKFLKAIAILAPDFYPSEFIRLLTTISSGTFTETDTAYIYGIMLEDSGPGVTEPVRIAELETICGETYQVLGALSLTFDVGGDSIIKAMDNLCECKLVHDDVLPFVLSSTPRPFRDEGQVEAVAIALSQWRHDRNLGLPTWDELEEHVKKAYRDQAQAAIAAIRKALC